METILETKARSILQFIHGLRGELHVTWEEGTWAAWLYDLLQPQVQQVLVCNPRRNALLKEGSKSDKVDARKLAELLRTGMLRAVYEECQQHVEPRDTEHVRKHAANLRTPPDARATTDTRPDSVARAALG